MPGVRRSQLAVEAARRAREQRIRIGGEIRAMRERRGWTRTELSRRAGIGRMVESRVERGQTNLDIDVLQRIGLAMDRPLIVTFGRDLLEAPADAGHLAMQELVLRTGRAAGFHGSFELATRPAEPWRSVDVGLMSESLHRMVLVECWNTFGDSVRRHVRPIESGRTSRSSPQPDGGPMAVSASSGSFERRQGTGSCFSSIPRSLRLASRPRLVDGWMP